MKNVKSVSKRTIAVFMAVLMLMSFAATGAFAALDYTLSASDNGTNIVVVASNTAYTYTVTPPSGATATAEGANIIITKPADGSFKITATKDSETKDVTFTAEKVDLTATPNHEKKSFALSTTSGKSLTFFVKNYSSAGFAGDTVYNLKSGTAYEIIGYYYDSAASKLYYASVTTEKLKDAQTAPANVSATADTTSITVDKITGAQYMLAETESGTIIKSWSDENVFTGLTTGVWYTVSVRMKATADLLESEATSISVKTLQKNPDEVKDVDITSVTKNSITVKEIEGYEYSMDGKTWVTSGKFTGLTANKDYKVYQRIAAYGEYAPSEAKSKAVTTNSADVYTASMSKVEDIKWATEDVRVGNNTVTLYGDIREDGNIQWGDTRIVPVIIEDNAGFKIDTKNVAADKDKIKAADKIGKRFTAVYNPASTGERKITVTYEEQQYKGVDGWVTLKTVTKTYNVTVKHSNDGAWGFLVQIMNALLVTIPKYMSQLIVWLNEHGISFLIGI